MQKTVDANRKFSFPAVWREGCRVLILGSLPGDESLRQARYYAHPRNVFWRLMGDLFGFDPVVDYSMLLSRLRTEGVALWDVVADGCREGSLDQHIEGERPNDIPWLLDKCPTIALICCNGTASHRFLRKYFPEIWQRESIRISRLPSTSPAAARLSYEEKRRIWFDELFPVLRGDFIMTHGRIAEGK